MTPSEIQEMNRSITERLAPMFEELEQAHCRRVSREAKLDPQAHKLTRVFDHGANYRYWQTKNGKGQRVLFCYSVHRNAAGYFMGWRETYMKNGFVKRDMWLARRRKKACIEIAKRRAGIKPHLETPLEL
jgi:hypothetical protein